MATSKASTVTAFLATLPADRRKVVAAVRALIRANLPAGYEESVGSGGLCYSVPLSVLPDTYNGHPLWYVALVPQKNYYSLHLLSVYGDSEKAAALKDAFAKAGKKLDMGKACIRFRTLDDLPLDVIAKTIAATPMAAYVAMYRAIANRRKT